jgi:hypothetical protein
MTLTKRLFAAALFVSTSFAPLGATSATAQVLSGTLQCNVAAGVGLVITSSRALTCLYTNWRGKHETYTGTIQKFGLDLGATNEGSILWNVVTANPRHQPHYALAGEYSGPTASLTVGPGVGGNVLVGGGNGISLQPVSVTAQTGLNLAAGIGAINLEPAPRTR